MAQIPGQQQLIDALGSSSGRLTSTTPIQPLPSPAPPQQESNPLFSQENLTALQQIIKALGKNEPQTGGALGGSGPGKPLSGLQKATKGTPGGIGF